MENEICYCESLYYDTENKRIVYYRTVYHPFGKYKEYLVAGEDIRTNWIKGSYTNYIFKTNSWLDYLNSLKEK